jgi:NADPH-dependent 2,4-dienoyl-CoA reductase/sulfur reductase-like enzyme
VPQYCRYDNCHEACQWRGKGVSFQLRRCQHYGKLVPTEHFDMSLSDQDQHDEGATPLHILVVGAGIGGLTAALALRQQGHDLEVFEQSKLAQETGAAIHLASNANGLLRRLGLYAEDIGAVECTGVLEYIPHDGSVKYHINTKPISDRLWAHPW